MAPVLEVAGLSTVFHTRTGIVRAVQDVSFSTIFYGVIPFVVTDILRLAILIAFPVIATWLPGRM